MTAASSFAPLLERLEDRHVPTTLFGLTTANEIVRFEDSTPSQIDATVAVTGLAAGDVLQGIDFRPQDGTLFGLAQNGTVGDVYTIDPSTGAATLVNTLVQPLTAGANFGVDFNPTANALRIVNDDEQNLRIGSGGTGGASAQFNDSAINQTGESAGTLSVTGAAYTNNKPGGGTSGATTLYTIDSGRDLLLIQGSKDFFTGKSGGVSPNTGTLTTVGSLGVDTSAEVGFDVSASDNTAFASLAVGGASQLYKIDLSSGSATLVGAIGSGMVLRDVAIGTSVLQFNPTAVSVSENAGQAEITVTRTNGTAGRVSVDYTMKSGTATNGADFTGSSGTLVFEDGQSSATISVPILDDFRVEADETFTVTLSNAAGGARLSGTASSTATVTIHDDGDSLTSSNERYVRQLYATLLGRAADAGGVAGYTARLDAGAPRGEITTEITRSREYAELQVGNLYRQILGREADAGGLKGYTDLILGDDWRVEMVAADLYGSKEYRPSAPTDAQFVNAIYSAYLQRTPDDAARNAYLARLSDGESRFNVALEIIDSTDSDAVAIRAAYQQYLGRSADDDGLAAYVTLLKSSTPKVMVTASITASDEYFKMIG